MFVNCFEAIDILVFSWLDFGRTDIKEGVRSSGPCTRLLKNSCSDTSVPQRGSTMKRRIARIVVGFFFGTAVTWCSALAAARVLSATGSVDSLTPCDTTVSLPVKCKSNYTIGVSSAQTKPQIFTITLISKQESTGLTDISVSTQKSLNPGESLSSDLSGTWNNPGRNGTHSLNMTITAQDPMSVAAKSCTYTVADGGASARDRKMRDGIGDTATEGQSRGIIRGQLGKDQSRIGDEATEGEGKGVIRGKSK